MDNVTITIFSETFSKWIVIRRIADLTNYVYHVDKIADNQSSFAQCQFGATDELDENQDGIRYTYQYNTAYNLARMTWT